MYQALRSISDNHVFVVCRDGAFYDLPEVVRHRGPWQGMGRGDVGKSQARARLDLEEQGYSLVRSDLAVFKPEL